MTIPLNTWMVKKPKICYLSELHQHTKPSTRLTNNVGIWFCGPQESALLDFDPCESATKHVHYQNSTKLWARMYKPQGAKFYVFQT